MLEYINSMLGMTLICLGVSTYILKALVPQWNLREYSTLEGYWKSILIWSSLISVVCTATIVNVTGSGVMAVIFGTLIFFLMFGAQTDYILHLVPREVTSLAVWVGLAAGAAGLVSGERVIFPMGGSLSESLLSLAVYTGAICLVFLSLLIKPFVGFADVKLFWATGFFISWYMGYAMLIIFAFANLLLFVSLILNQLNRKSRKSNIAVLPAFSIAVTLGSVFLLSVS